MNTFVHLPAFGKKCMDALCLYIGMRARQALRLLGGIGVVRSLLLLTALALLVCLLVKMDNRWVIVAGAIAGLFFYHHARKDRNFLTLQVAHPERLMRLEYLLMGLPIMGIELWKGHLIETVLIALAALLLPGLRPFRWRVEAIPLPFLYRGGMEYLRMFRQLFWLYLLLVLFSLAGTFHGNIRVVKVAMIVWGIAQCSAFMGLPLGLSMVAFRDYQTFQGYLLRSIVWNGFVTLIPLGIILLSFSFNRGDICFLVAAFAGGILSLYSMGMIRYLCTTLVGIAFYFLLVVIPLFFYGIFMWELLVVLGIIDVILCVSIYNRWKWIWS